MRWRPGAVRTFPGVTVGLASSPCSLRTVSILPDTCSGSGSSNPVGLSRLVSPSRHVVASATSAPHRLSPTCAPGQPHLRRRARAKNLSGRVRHVIPAPPDRPSPFPVPSLASGRAPRPWDVSPRSQSKWDRGPMRAPRGEKCPHPFPRIPPSCPRYPEKMSVGGRIARPLPAPLHPEPPSW